VADRGWRLVAQGESGVELRGPDEQPLAKLTLNRDLALSGAEIDLLGLDHPILQAELRRWASLEPEVLGAAVQADIQEPALLAGWHVETRSDDGHRRELLQTLCVGRSGRRWPGFERRLAEVLSQPAVRSISTGDSLLRWYGDQLEPALHRECLLRLSGQRHGFSAELLFVVELVPGRP
jgi:hypothetical protein